MSTLCHVATVTTGVSPDSIPVSPGDIHTETGNIVTANPPVVVVLILIEEEVEMMVGYILPTRQRGKTI